MTHYIIRLKFRSGVRVGDAGIGLEGVTPLIHSDTLFSALCHTLALIKGSDWVTQMLETFEAHKPFIVSSCFPYRADTYYVPRPYLRVRQWSRAHDNLYKQLKTLRWIGANSLADWLDEKPMDLEKLLEENSEAQQCETYSFVPAVALDRIDQKSQLYFRGFRVFAGNAGLYFVLQLNDENDAPLLRRAVELLGCNGLGSERNCGYGCFDAEWLPAAALEPLLERTGDRSYLLSLYHPKHANIDAADSFFALEERRGWFYSPTGRHMKRKSVWMFAEGSVFSGDVEGDLVDVSPQAWKAENQHKIIRCGIPLTIKF